MDNIAVTPSQFQENITLRTVGGNMALKFSTGANDSLRPELVRAGFTPENATATLAALGKYLGAKAIKASINADLPLGKSLGRKG